MPRARLQVLFAVALLWLSACDHGLPPGGDDPPEANFANVQQIFSRSCALSGCHAGATPAMDMNLSVGNAYANIVGVPSLEVPQLERVTPFDPDASYLVMKIEGAPSIVGARMPLGRDPLPQAEILLIREWILGGALED